MSDQNNQKNSKTFVNPYNFTSVDLKNTLRQDITQREEETFSGVLECSMTTKTPLAIPETVPAQEDFEILGHNKYDFFHYTDGKPVVPGSTIRGVVRSVYETATNSCYVTADIDESITRRTSTPFEPGILMNENGKWVLYKAGRHLLKVEHGTVSCSCFNDHKKKFELSKEQMYDEMVGNKVFIKSNTVKNRNFVTELYTSKCDNIKEGYLYAGESFDTKKYESVFVKKDRVQVRNIEKSIHKLEQSIDVYRNEKINGNIEKKTHSGYKWYEAAKKKGVIPLWYNKVDVNRDEYYLSMACIGRSSYNKNMGDLLANKSPCVKRSKICPACSLFGMIGEEAVGSRIRITDAKVKEWSNQQAEKNVTLRELAGPKSSYLPFYSNKGKGDAWSYDSTASIKGRKFYWHTKSEYYKYNIENGVKKSIEKTKRNATMDLVKEDTKFYFSIYYDRITKGELDNLLWVLSLGDNRDDSTLCYKIGHGKPIGLGSVKVVVQSNKMKSYQVDTSKYVVENELLEGKTVVNPFENTKHIQELLAIMDMKTVENENVEYPSVYQESYKQVRQNDLAAHKWFTYNFGLGANKSKVVTPTILDEDKSIIKNSIEEINGNTPNNNSNNRNSNNRNNNNNTSKNNGKFKYKQEETFKNCPFANLSDICKFD